MWLAPAAIWMAASGITETVSVGVGTSGLVVLMPSCDTKQDKQEVIKLLVLGHL